MHVEQIRNFLNHTPHNRRISFRVLKSKSYKKFNRRLIAYEGSEHDEIRAYLFIPKARIRGSILVHHQHHGQRHFGKSEVAGKVGDPFQHFCPALAKSGFIALAPDSICFEDRRTNLKGVVADEEEDWLQHYNQMCYRLLTGDGLMKKVLDDASRAVCILEQLNVAGSLGVLGHSYGGNTAIFQGALDQRLGWVCSSGAVCSFVHKLKVGTGIEMAEVIPGFMQKFKFLDLLSCIAPRKFLIVAADKDKFTGDAIDQFRKLRKVYGRMGMADNLTLHNYRGGHGLTKKRFKRILNWFEINGYK